MSPAIRRSDSHEYTVDGVAYAGVTSVIGSVIRKPELERWMMRVGLAEAERVRNEAADFGTLVHAIAFLQAEEVPSIAMGDEHTADTAPQVDAFMAWLEETIAEVYATELMVAHEGYRYAGTLDMLCRFKGDKVPTVVDLKTGKGVYAEMRYQSAAYREAVLPLLPDYGFTAKRCRCRRGVLHIPRQGKLRFYEHPRHQEDFQGFLSCLYLYHDLRQGV